MMKDAVIHNEANYIVSTYVRPNLVLERGEGVYLYDTEGRRYLDFMAGIAVNALGHADPEWVAAVSKQASQLTHVSNLYHTAPQTELACRLVENSFADRVFFCNSGSEANETALKFARKYAQVTSTGSTKSRIVAFSGSFHGRTMGALSTTYKAKYREPFMPLLPDVVFAEFNDVEAAQDTVTEQTCAVIVEPVQGEGGINPARPHFLQALRDLCDESGALLIFDEVQCGLGRTGSLWAHESYGVQPDIMTLAKPLAGGLPIGATLVTEAVADVIQPGDHGSTFAGGPLICRAGQVVFDRINHHEFLENVRENGAHLRARLRDLDAPFIADVRGRGLLTGLELHTPAMPLLEAARERGLLIIVAGENVVRICPPLIITREQIDEGVSILEECLGVLETA